MTHGSNNVSNNTNYSLVDDNSQFTDFPFTFNLSYEEESLLPPSVYVQKEHDTIPSCGIFYTLEARARLSGTFEDTELVSEVFIPWYRYQADAILRIFSSKPSSWGPQSLKKSGVLDGIDWSWCIDCVFSALDDERRAKFKVAGPISSDACDDHNLGNTQKGLRGPATLNITLLESVEWESGLPKTDRTLKLLEITEEKVGEFSAEVEVTQILLYFIIELT